MEATYKVSGMTCSGCVSSVTAALRRRSDDWEVEVSLDAGTATVRGEHDEAAVGQAIEAAGFDFGGKV